MANYDPTTYIHGDGPLPTEHFWIKRRWQTEWDTNQIIWMEATHGPYKTYKGAKRTFDQLTPDPAAKAELLKQGRFVGGIELEIVKADFVYSSVDAVKWMP